MSERARDQPSRVALFVYGSLKAGYENAHLLAGAIALGVARTARGYRLIRYHDGFPALVSVARSEGSVLGELYSVDLAQLAALDAFEECPTLYRREVIELDDGRIAEAYVAAEGDDTAWPVIEGY